MNKINVQQKLATFGDYWNPRIVGELNGQYVKLVKFKDEFIWHHHDAEDELFLVFSGVMRMEFRDRTEIVGPGEMIIVPRGVEHRPCAEGEVHVMLFEPATTLNTGNIESERTRKKLDRI